MTHFVQVKKPGHYCYYLKKKQLEASFTPTTNS